MKKRTLALAVGFPAVAMGAVAVALAFLLRRYRRDTDASRSTILDTASPIDTGTYKVTYAEKGEGPPVLVIHGAAGGHDQGLLVGDLLAGPHRCIAPSRFGYLGSAMPREATPAEQALACRELLDVLDVDRVPVVGFSAGARTALEFARLFPERCSALVLLSGATFPPFSAPASKEPSRAVLSAMDLFVWCLAKCVPAAASWFAGANPGWRRTASAHEQDWVERLVDTLQPMAWRFPGVVNDLKQLQEFDPETLRHVRVPTLFIHAADDRHVPVACTRKAHEWVLDSRYIELPSGGHLLIGHHDRVSGETARFLARHVAPVPPAE